MDFEHDSSWDAFAKAATSGLPIEKGWKQIIGFHKKIKPKKYWTGLTQLDVETEQKEIKEWLESLVAEEPFAKDIISLWIGINKFLDNTNKEVYAIYLTGCTTYDKENIEWATEPSYLPENRYFISEILNEIDEKIKKDEEDYEILDWILPLAYTSLTLNDLIRNRLDSSNFLKHRKKIFVTNGFDGGDFFNLTAIGDK